MTKPSTVKVTGPLQPFADGFIEELARLGYTPLSAASQVRVLAHLSRWMASEGIDAGRLNMPQITEFLQVRRHAGYVEWTSKRGLATLLSFLRSTGIVSEVLPIPVKGSVEELLDAYQKYLLCERGLVAGTVHNYLLVARLFLMTYEETDLSLIQALHVRAFVLSECSKRNTGSLQNLASGLRCLLRYMFVGGQVSTDLSSAVPAVANRRRDSLPKALDRDTVARLLASCDRRTNSGKRDFAILTLLARLGLRSGEVAALSLDDVDWRAGEIAVCGKGNREERLPLSVDVGDALVDYLRRRRLTEHRTVFLCVRAPHNPVSTGVIKNVVYEACIRAGIPKIGPHRLRHSLATNMLVAGASLGEIGQVLRHRRLATTAIYAKVNIAAQRQLALPWPGGAL
jgi:integrase/recombinase XerD